MKTRNALRSISAVNDQNPRVPKGFVRVTAVQGGLMGLTDGGNPKRLFLVPAAEYAPGMLVEVSRHAEVKETDKDPKGPDEPGEESGDPEPDPEEGATGQALPWSSVIARFNVTNQTREGGGGNHGWRGVIGKFNSGARR